jgi:hypothetical protein
VIAHHAEEMTTKAALWLGLHLCEGGGGSWTRTRQLVGWWQSSRHGRRRRFEPPVRTRTGRFAWAARQHWRVLSAQGRGATAPIGQRGRDTQGREQKNGIAWTLWPTWRPRGRRHPTSGPHTVASTGSMAGGPHTRIFLETQTNLRLIFGSRKIAK